MLCLFVTLTQSQEGGASALSVDAASLSASQKVLSHADWLARADERKRAALELKAREEEAAKAAGEAIKAVSALQFEKWKKRKGTLDVAVEVQGRWLSLQRSMLASCLRQYDLRAVHFVYPFTSRDMATPHWPSPSSLLWWYGVDVTILQSLRVMRQFNSFSMDWFEVCMRG